MNNESQLQKKVAILTEQYRNINEAYVESLSELLVLREDVKVLYSKNVELQTELDQLTILLSKQPEE